MKLINKLGLLVVAALAMVACVDQDPEINNFPDADVDFTYCVAGDEYVVDYYVVSPIQFNNISAKTGTVTWDFGDGTTSNEANPIHKYAVADNYNVTLTIDAADGKTYSRTYPLMIYDIVPKLSVAEQSDSIIEINSTTVAFNLELPNPEDLTVKYTWTFPAGTKFEDEAVAAAVQVNAETGAAKWVGYGKKVGEEYVIDYPGKVRFANIGSQRVDIETDFDFGSENERPLEPSYYNVQVACNYEAPTLYYAEVDGNIKALKLISESDPQYVAGTKVSAYDMGVKAGNKPFNICYGAYDALTDEGTVGGKQHCIYILDAGKQYYYVNDESDNLGDGKITAMNVDGTGVNTVVSNEGQQAFMDPYCGWVADGYLYYSDRNYGVSKIALNTRGEVESQRESDASFRATYEFNNDIVPYYGRPIAYGAINAGHQKVGDMWWWGKNYGGNAIMRFKNSDIYGTSAEALAAASPYAVIMQGIKFRTFAVDAERNALYIWRIDPTGSGFYHYAMPGEQETGNQKTYVSYTSMAADPVNTTDDEQVHTTQFAIDQNTGRVFFCFRAEDENTSAHKTGIYYYDPATNKVESYHGVTDAGYGITINPTPSKLF